MEVSPGVASPATSSPAAAASAIGSASDGSATPAISSDFETFLKMLTVQMQNQDPLNPIDSSDYAVQLATFSGVEQQVKTNDLLDAMSGQLGAMGMADLAGWVGMEARAVTPTWFSDTPVTLQPKPASGAEHSYVVVHDASGAVVDRVEIPVSDDPVQWAGVDGSGKPFPPGLYSFNLQSFSQNKIIADEPMAAYSEVVEARAENGKIMLVLKGGSEVAASDIDSLRMPHTAG